MQAVGRLGSYISKSVYTVSGPFHPFGGAVDIIVVLQPDGSYKSSPWYVRFGKFQGVLKTKEKLVRITINGIEADFHMYLDHKGEAYFLKEVDVDDPESACSPPSSSGEDTENRQPIKSLNCNYDANLLELNGNSISRSNSRQSQILGRVFGNRSVKVSGEDESGVVRTESMERAEIAADLLDLKWSTNLGRKKIDNASRFSTEDFSKDDETCVDSNSSYQEVVSTDIFSLAKDGDANSVTVIKSEIGFGEAIEGANGSLCCGGGNEVCDHSETTRLISEVTFEPERDVTHLHPLDDFLQDAIFMSKEERIILGEDQVSKNESYICPGGDAQISNNDYVIRDILSSEISNEELLLFGELDDSDSSESKHVHEYCEEKEADSSISVRVAEGNIESIVNDCTNDSSQPEKRLRMISSDVNINAMGQVQSKELTRTARSLPSLSTLSNDFDAGDLDNSFGTSLQSVAEDVTIIKANGVGPANPSVGNSGHPPRPLEGSRRSWPFSFKRSKNMNVSDPVAVGSENSNGTKILKTTSDPEGIKDATKVMACKKKIRIGTPTSEELASLNLKEGKNIVIFTFSTGMLGQQQVDARIFLWRWDTRVVISDVDGTITRSDLLGQFMPLVGRDWSHSGVAHLFSSIKDNGYQLLFLSARSISQAFLTRQFLFNIKQDGKALPEGPVVISPDGLFPSLFREVVRRAPHEFKIACLEDIKALFPADTNPFYAGFGNRNTDEVSYLKVGIPRNKIFIINPKGEIVVNRRIDTKSYLSLHTLVHGMFPTMSSSEQEDFNSWNYWKIPPSIIDV